MLLVSPQTLVPKWDPIEVARFKQGDGRRQPPSYKLSHETKTSRHAPDTAYVMDEPDDCLNLASLLMEGPSYAYRRCLINILCT